MTDQEALTLVAEHTGKFLKAYGGMSSGYDTTVNGKLHQNSIGGLRVFTPECEYKTYQQVYNIGRILEKELQGILLDNKFFKLIAFESLYATDGCGCADIVVSCTTEHRVIL